MDTRPPPTGALTVRQLAADEMGIRIRSSHDASDEHLRRMGVDRAPLPPPDEWAAADAVGAARPREERSTASLAWELDGRVVGSGARFRYVRTRGRAS